MSKENKTEAEKVPLLGSGRSDSDEEAGLPLSNGSSINSAEPERRLPFMPERGSLMYTKYSYYMSLNPPDLRGKRHNPLAIPRHLIPPELFVLQIPGAGKPGVSKQQGSLTTIFSIWNTMMGTSLLAIAWGFTQSGLVAGLLTMLAMGILCCYTCYLVVLNGSGYTDFMDIAKMYLGRIGHTLGFASSVLILVGALIAYDILMSDCLFENVNSIRYFAAHGAHDATKSYPYWSSKIAPLVIFAVLFPIINLKSFALLVKVNSLGIIAVGYISVFIVVSCFTGGGVDGHHATGLELHNIPLFESKFYYLAGLLIMSFFLHNCILPILTNAKRPENNIRDLIIGFILVGLTYALIGGVGYLAYHLNTIPQNFLTIYSQTYIPAIIAKFALLFQLVSVYPLLTYIIRLQFFGFLRGSSPPPLWQVVLLNFALIAISSAFAIFYPFVGTVLRFTGAGCGFIYVFLLPVAVHLRAVKAKEGKYGIARTIANGFVVFVGAVLLLAQFI